MLIAGTSTTSASRLRHWTALIGTLATATVASMALTAPASASVSAPRARPHGRDRHTTPMSNDQGGAIAGRGRLADVIATRGGLAAPQAPFVIEHREALIYMLCEAAELEHGIMCQYLFAAFSLKQDASEELSGPELGAVQRWRKQIFASGAGVPPGLGIAIDRTGKSGIGPR